MDLFSLEDDGSNELFLTQESRECSQDDSNKEKVRILVIQWILCRHVLA